MKTKDVKISKKQMSKAVNVIITFPNGKIVDLSFGETADFFMVHHTTTINRICLRPLSDKECIVTETTENGSVRNIHFPTD